MRNVPLALTVLLCGWATILSSGNAATAPDPGEIQKARAAALADPLSLPTGESYEVKVPDTLDLTDRANLALNGLSGILDPNASYEFWWRIGYNSRPVQRSYDARSFAACGQKILESFPMMIAMTGNGKFQKEFLGLKNLLVSWIADDGLMYCHVGEDRPWDKVTPEDYANVYGQGRMMLAMMALYDFDRNPAWLTLTGKMAEGLERIAIDKGDYAYYPVNMGNDKIKIGEGYCYLKQLGWLDTNEANSEREGAEGSMFMYHCGVIRALSRWYERTGDQKSIQLARKLVNYVMQERFWGTGQPEPQGSEPSDRAHFGGHAHGHAAMLFALAEFANAANDSHLKEYVRAGYEWARNPGIARLGLFGEACTISDMIGTAIKLSDGGTADYWDDVDGYIRNQMVEQQLVDAKQLQKVVQAADSPAPKAPDPMVERALGIYADDADLGCIPDTLSIQCCSGNGTQGLYYAWAAIIRQQGDDGVQVNLLLDRASPWMDISSYLPYEGKVVFSNKTVKSLSVRIPNWVDRKALGCTVGGDRRSFTWVSNYMVLGGLRPKDEIVLTFPVSEQTVHYTVLTHQQWTSDPRPDAYQGAHNIKYTCQFKGNTLVDFSPRPDDRWYLNYQREEYKGSQTPMKSVSRFVTASTPHP